MKNYKVEICFIGNAIVDILSKTSNEMLHKLRIPKGSMQIVEHETCDKILKYIQFPLSSTYDSLVVIIIFQINLLFEETD